MLPTALCKMQAYMNTQRKARNKIKTYNTAPYLSEWCAHMYIYMHAERTQYTFLIHMCFGTRGKLGPISAHRQICRVAKTKCNQQPLLQ